MRNNSRIGGTKKSESRDTENSKSKHKNVCNNGQATKQNNTK